MSMTRRNHNRYGRQDGGRLVAREQKIKLNWIPKIKELDTMNALKGSMGERLNHVIAFTDVVDNAGDMPS